MLTKVFYQLMMFRVTKEDRAAGMSILQREREKKRQRITNKQESRLNKLRKNNERIDSEDSDDKIKYKHTMRRKRRRALVVSDSEKKEEEQEQEQEEQEEQEQEQEQEGEEEQEEEEQEQEQEQEQEREEREEQEEQEQEQQQQEQQEQHVKEKDFPVEMSIFKLNVHKINGLSHIKSEKQLLKKLVKAVTKMGCVDHKPVIYNKCKPFLRTYFYYKTESAKNYTAFSINRDCKLKDSLAFLPGSRNPGNILTYYRLKMENNALPEVYFLCNGYGYHAILHLCDTTFRAKIAKKYIDGKRIKEIETTNIAGPDVTTKITYKSNFNIDCHSESFLEKVVNSLAGYLKTDTDLYKVIQSKDGQDVLMKIGLNYVRVC
ncbi:UPF0746 protein DDB_G0281095-like [Mytilus trossulus]|uniref:UPF0746 protein DDB_G0281095-like n=1 Tax=Mytilus trossulus TaxID=6551 RepID=UPI00300681CD